MKQHRNRECATCGKELTCSRCTGQKGGRKAALMFTTEQRSEWSKQSGGGRPPGKQDEKQRKKRGPRLKRMVQDPVTGASVPTPKTPVRNYGIDPTRLYLPEVVARLCSVDHETLRHWRAKDKGPAYIK